MNTWFECKVKYTKVDQQGRSKRVSEDYLVDAVSFSDAEARVSREVAPYVNGEFSIVGMKKAPINEIFPSEEGDRWFRCKVLFVSIDEVKATEKKVSSNILVFGLDIDNAWKHLSVSLSDSVSDYEVSSITETKIVDIFPFTDEEVSGGLTPRKFDIGVSQSSDEADLLSDADGQQDTDTDTGAARS